MRSNAMVKHIGGPAAGGPLAVMPTAQVLALRQRVARYFRLSM